MNYSYRSYTRVITAVALFAGIILLWPGKLFFLNDDFLHLYLTSQGKWLQQNSLRPVCDFSMWLDYQIWGLNAVGFHLTNALLHLTCSFLVYIFSRKFLERFHQSAIAGDNALLIAAIFFVYAFHGETIYWVIGRSSSLGVLWFLLSLIFYLNRDRRSGFLLAMLFFTVGLFTYESVWIAPLVFLAISWLDVHYHQTKWKHESRWVAISFMLLLVYFLVRYLLIQQVVAEYEGSRFLQWDVKGLALNFVKLILRSLSQQSGNFYLLGIAFLLALTAVISFLFTRQRKFAWMVLLLWLISYLPYLSLGIDTFGSEGERFLYLPSVLLSIIIGIGMVNAARVYKYVISLLFFFVHILLLYQKRETYQVASAVTRSTVEAVATLQDKDTIYIISLPIENNGALIFRAGVQEAVQLFSQSPRRVEIVSEYEGNFSFFNGVSEQDWTEGLPGNPGKDAVLDFSKSSLMIFR